MEITLLAIVTTLGITLLVVMSSTNHHLKNIANTMMADEYRRQQEIRIKAAEARVNATVKEENVNVQN